VWTFTFPVYRLADVCADRNIELDRARTELSETRPRMIANNSFVLSMLPHWKLKVLTFCDSFSDLRFCFSAFWAPSLWIGQSAQCKLFVWTQPKNHQSGEIDTYHSHEGCIVLWIDNRSVSTSQQDEEALLLWELPHLLSIQLHVRLRWSHCQHFRDMSFQVVAVVGNSD
jgi:hypothetical protein